MGKPTAPREREIPRLNPKEPTGIRGVVLADGRTHDECKNCPASIYIQKLRGGLRAEVVCRVLDEVMDNNHSATTKEIEEVRAAKKDPSFTCPAIEQAEKERQNSARIVEYIREILTYGIDKSLVDDSIYALRVTLNNVNISKKYDTLKFLPKYEKALRERYNRNSVAAEAAIAASNPKKVKRYNDCIEKYNANLHKIVEAQNIELGVTIMEEMERTALSFSAPSISFSEAENAST